MKINKSVVIVTIVLLAISGLGVYKLTENQEIVESRVTHNDPNKAFLVKTHTIHGSAFSEDISAVGTFEPVREVTVLSQANGMVQQINFDLGEPVKAGQTLVTVDKDILSAQYEAAEANYLNTKSNLERYELANKSEGIPQIQIDQARLAVQSAESQMKVLAKQLQHTTIKAPFGGVVTEKNIELGSTLGAGTKVATITDISRLKLTVQIPEKEIASFKEGHTIDIVCDLYSNQPIAGKIVMVGAKADRAHNYPVQIEVKNSEDKPLKAGMYGSVANTDVTTNALLVPKKALVGSEKDPQVYVVVDGKAVLRNIALASSNSDMYVVQSGLKEGDVVVVSGQINLADATPVTIAQTH